MNKIKAASFALVVVAANAHAGAVGEVPPEYWSGTYLGAHLGAGAGTTNQTFSDKSVDTQKYTPSPTNITKSLGSGSRQGNITGSNLDVFAGYNVHLTHPNYSKFVLGGQFEGTLFNDTTMKASGTRLGKKQAISLSGSTVSSNTISNSSTLSELTTDLQSTVSLVGRAGYLAKPDTLLYALVGATEGDFRFSDVSAGGAAVAAGAGGATGNILSKWQLGVTAGAGVEYKLSQHWSILGEYRYLHFNLSHNQQLTSNTTSINDLTKTPTSTISSSSEANTHASMNFNLGQLGVVYRI